MRRSMSSPKQSVAGSERAEAASPEASTSNTTILSRLCMSIVLLLRPTAQGAKAAPPLSHAGGAVASFEVSPGGGLEYGGAAVGRIRRSRNPPIRRRSVQCGFAFCTLPEMLGELQALGLVARTQVLPVEHLGNVGQPFVKQAADGLAVLEHEGDVEAAHFQHRPGAFRLAADQPEARIEE